MPDFVAPGNWNVYATRGTFSGDVRFLVQQALFWGELRPHLHITIHHLSRRISAFPIYTYHPMTGGKVAITYRACNMPTIHIQIKAVALSHNRDRIGLIQARMKRRRALR